jgi:drug/metabolite transporter (DMT)-like permease
LADTADRRGLIMAAAAASGLGLAVAVSRYAYEGGTNGLTVAASRSCVAVLILVLFCWATGRQMRVAFRDWLNMAGLGVLMSMMYYGNVGSVEFISIGLAALLFYTYPPIVAIIYALILRERVPAPKVLALGAAFAGLALMLGASLGVSDGRGVALALGASFACAWNAVWLARRVAHLDGVVVTLHMALVAAPILLLLTLSTGSVQVPDQTIGWLGLAGVVILQCTAMPFYFVAIPRIGALRSAMVSNVQPVVSIVAAYIMFGELVTAVQFAGGVLVLGGIALSQWYDSSRGASVGGALVKGANKS